MQRRQISQMIMQELCLRAEMLDALGTCSQRKSGVVFSGIIRLTVEKSSYHQLSQIEIEW